MQSLQIASKNRGRGSFTFRPLVFETFQPFNTLHLSSTCLFFITQRPILNKHCSTAEYNNYNQLSGTVLWQSTAAAAVENPYQIRLCSGEGFHPALDEKQRLDAIDRRLQRLLPKSDYDSIATTPAPSRGSSQQVGLLAESRGQPYVSRFTKRI